MAASLESNLRQLLAHCEAIAAETPDSWRLKKYMKSLDTMTVELDSLSSRPSLTAMDEYFTRVDALKRTINYQPDSPLPSRKLKLRQHSSDPSNGEQRPRLGTQRGEAHIREIKQIIAAQEAGAERQALLGDGDAQSGPACLCAQTPCTCGGIIGESQARRRRRVGAPQTDGTPAANGGQAMGQAMKYYDDVQERIADDMLQLTRSLREQTETANRIIRRDTEVVQTSSTLSERNMSALDRESERLAEHSKRACKCWLWMMIGFVMVTFIFMVMFMKIMKKKT